MSKSGVYGSEVEIMSFVDLFNVFTKVIFQQSEKSYHFGHYRDEFKLILLFTGNYDNGHFDIHEFRNKNLGNVNHCNDLNRPFTDIIDSQNVGPNYVLKDLKDGNGLFRCFFFFLYNSENYHTTVRQKIVNYVVNNWMFFE